MRERGGAPIGQSGVVTSGATESHSMQLATGSQESSSHLSILSSLSEDLSLQGFSVFWKISISVGRVEEVVVASPDPYLHCLQFLQISPWTTFSLLTISLCGIVGWGVGGGLGSVALLDSHLQALFTFGRCSRCYRIVPWQKSSQWNWLRGNYVDYWGQQQTVNPREGWA